MGYRTTQRSAIARLVVADMRKCLCEKADVAANALVRERIGLSHHGAGRDSVAVFYSVQRGNAIDIEQNSTGSRSAC